MECSKHETLRELVGAVASGSVKSLLVRGPGGLGKTFVVTDELHKLHRPAIVLKGYTTAAGFYNFLYENRQELILVDDCDDIFKDMTGLNILKAVLDSYDVRLVCWNTANSSAVPVPQFEFLGQIVFLSNVAMKRLSQHMDAVLTRILCFNLDLTADEVLHQIKMLAIKGHYRTASKAEQYQAYRFLKGHMDRISELNFRHYTKAMDLVLSGNKRWRRLFLACLE